MSETPASGPGADARAIADLTAALLSGLDEESALQLVAERAHTVLGADTTLLVLPSVAETWVVEFTVGPGADGLLGVPMPEAGRSRSSLRSRTALRVADLSTADIVLVPELRRFGPALYAPLFTADGEVGVLVVLRSIGHEAFTGADSASAEFFAGQAAIALELARKRHLDEENRLLEERQRIARDLHDLAVQQLFAAGLQLETLRGEVVASRQRPTGRILPAAIADPLANSLGSTIRAIDDSVTQIRRIVHSLQPAERETSLASRLRHEVALGSVGLGFTPTLRLDPEFEPGGELGANEIGDDIVAVVREGIANAARHARASAVSVNLALQGAVGSEGTRELIVSIADNGAGIDVRPERRSGLANLASRAHHHGGTLRIEPTEPGTLLTWVIALEKGALGYS